MEGLYALAYALVNDSERFERLVEAGPPKANVFAGPIANARTRARRSTSPPTSGRTLGRPPTVKHHLAAIERIVI